MIITPRVYSLKEAKEKANNDPALYIRALAYIPGYRVIDNKLFDIKGEYVADDEIDAIAFYVIKEETKERI